MTCVGMCSWEFNIWPVWNYPRVDALEVSIDSYFVVLKKPLLMAVCSNYWQTRHRLTEVWVNRGAWYWVQPTQLSWCCYIEALGVERVQEKSTENSGRVNWILFTIGTLFKIHCLQSFLLVFRRYIFSSWTSFPGSCFSLCYFGQHTCTK